MPFSLYGDDGVGRGVCEGSVHAYAVFSTGPYGGCPGRYRILADLALIHVHSVYITNRKLMHHLCVCSLRLCVFFAGR